MAVAMRAKDGMPVIFAVGESIGGFSYDPVTDTARKGIIEKKLNELEPVLIEDNPNALDDLGLTEERRKMDEAHNEMIWKKYKLKVIQQIPGDLNLEPDTRAPFDRVLDPRPEKKIDRDELQRAIDMLSFEDPEYRAAAQEYFAAIIPEVKAETARLASELRAAREERARVMAEQDAKVNEAVREWKRFNRSINEEVKKFIYTDEGGRIESGHRPTTENRRSILAVGCPGESFTPTVNQVRYFENLKTLAEHVAEVSYESAEWNRKVFERLNAAVKVAKEKTGDGPMKSFFKSLFS